MAADISLKDEINIVIEPWREAKTKPPFTHEQLIIMALVLGGDELTSRQIIEWEVATFHYYTEMVCAQLWRRHMTDLEDSYPNMRGKRTEAKDFVEAHLVALDTFDALINEIKNLDSKESSWSTTEFAARIFLDNLIGHTLEGVFRFFDLPAELRTRIYDMVFRLPPSGLRFDSWLETKAQALSRDFSKEFSPP